MTAKEISFSVPATVECGQCGERCELTAWVLLSSVDRPDLVQRLASGSLGNRCPRCDSLVEADLPILVHRPEQGGTITLAFAPASPAVAPVDNARDVAEDLVQILFDRLELSGKGVEVLLIAVPRLALPILLARDLRQDMAVPPEQLDLPSEIAGSYRHALTRLRQRMGFP
jgi:CpXC protein